MVYCRIRSVPVMFRRLTSISGVVFSRAPLGIESVVRYCFHSCLLGIESLLNVELVRIEFVLKGSKFLNTHWWIL